MDTILVSLVFPIVGATVLLGFLLLLTRQFKHQMDTVEAVDEWGVPLYRLRNRWGWILLGILMMGMELSILSRNLSILMRALQYMSLNDVAFWMQARGAIYGCTYLICTILWMTKMKPILTNEEAGVFLWWTGIVEAMLVGRHILGYHGAVAEGRRIR